MVVHTADPFYGSRVLYVYIRRGCERLARILLRSKTRLLTDGDLVLASRTEWGVGGVDKVGPQSSR